MLSTGFLKEGTDLDVGLLAAVIAEESTSSEGNLCTHSENSDANITCKYVWLSMCYAAKHYILKYQQTKVLPSSRTMRSFHFLPFLGDAWWCFGLDGLLENDTFVD